ncbi:rhomboid family intramembrane serine protease [Rhodococcus sp. WMMA185]|uniref:rhomboid family intramembrane serine protease n=1 Tax=Rhodococcus sp. WMMA185 TaxID=679318 RepID=UPI00087882C8|nr:rhomboid family intramembrane serine protease [Rhodococcus sp. WMMA185]AOW93891.1 rhomboid family intramembrane serine protease [Rhodococcus sp. WMMA185]
MTNPGWGGAASEGTPPQPRCIRHPDRPTALSCTRCGRPSCPECLREAAVGYQCVDCVAAGQKDVRPVRNVAGAVVSSQQPTPWVTYALMAANVAVFLITAAQARSIMQNYVGSSLFQAWALWPRGVVDGQLVRIIGSGFLHFGLIHIAVNMFALWIIGRDTELILGRARYFVVYFASILGASAAVMLFQLGAVTAGASGAVFGLMGAQAIILLRLRRSPAPVMTVIAINVFISVTIPGISLWGHLGGLVTGAAATAGILYGPQLLGAGKNRDKAVTVGWVCLGAVVLVALAIIAIRILQLRALVGY